MSELKKNGFIIAVDAGHGSETAGKRTPKMPVDIDFDGDNVVDVKKGTSIKEHIANVGVCVFLAKELERCGFTVFKSAWDDENATNDPDVDLSKRQELIRKAGCQYSVSVHFNALGDGQTFNSGQGVGTYYHLKDERTRDSKALAEIVQKHLAAGTTQTNRGVNRGGFAMVNCLNLNTKASILVELAFMTNQNEAISMMGNAKFWKECAVEICKGFCEYLKVEYQEEKPIDQGEGNTSEPNKKMIYTVQLGAFRTLLTAKIFKEKIAKVGFRNATIKKITVNQKKLYAVQIGTYSNKEYANTILSKAQKSGLDGMVKEV
jgi:N-acetylmuramoyl-L-alanine amidase